MAAVALVGFAACENDSVDKSETKAEKSTIYATFDDDATRVVLGDNGYTPMWEAGDCINMNGMAWYTQEAGATAKFTGGWADINGDRSFMAYYPEGNYLEESREAVENSMPKQTPMLAIGTYEEGMTIKFKNMSALLKFVPEFSGDVVFKAVGGEALTGRFWYPETFDGEISAYEEYATATLTGCQAGKTYYISVLPTTLSEGLSVEFNGVEIKSGAVGQVLERNKIYNLGTLAMPYEVSAYSIPGTHNNWAAGQTPMYIVGDYCVAYGVEFAAADNKFKVLGPNDKWLGANALTVGKWTAVSTDGGDITIAAGAYDIYFSEAESKICVVAAGTEVPAMPVFSVGVIGLGGNWDVDKDMTLEGDYYTLKGVDVAATDSFKLRISDDWAENYGIASSTTADFVAIEKDTMYSLVQDGKNMQVAAGTYDLYFNYATKEFYALTPGTTPDDLSIPQYKVYVHPYNNVWTKFNLYSWDTAGANPTGAWPGATTTVTETINGYTYYVWTMPRSATGASLSIILNDGSSQTADFALGTLDKDYYLLLNGVTLSFVEDKENPEPEVVQGEPQPSTWALAGDFNSWGDLVMYTTDVDGLFVAKGVNIGAYKEIKIKQVGNWNTSYGGGINYLNANIWTKVYSGGSNLSIINAGKYDIYFDNTNKRIYVMTEGTDYATATEQSANGAAPDLSGASWGLCGSHNNWSSPDIKLEWDGTIGLYVALNAKLTGEFKVRANNSWGEDYGCGGTITVNATAGKAMSRGGGNCKVASGTYDVYFDLTSKKIWVKTPGSAAPTK